MLWVFFLEGTRGRLWHLSTSPPTPLLPPAWESFLPTGLKPGWGPLAPSRVPVGAAAGGLGQGECRGSGILTGLQGLPPPREHSQGQGTCGGQAFEGQHTLALLPAGNSSTSHTLSSAGVVLVDGVGAVDHGNHGATASLRLEKTSEVTKSNHQPSSTTLVTTTPVPQCHIHTPVKPLKDGNSTTALGRPFHAEIFHNIHPEPPLVQPEAISSHLSLVIWEKRPNPYPGYNFLSGKCVLKESGKTTCLRKFSPSFFPNHCSLITQPQIKPRAQIKLSPQTKPNLEI